MPLQSPKRNAAGFFITLNPPLKAPSIPFASGQWTLNAEWCTWADGQRSALLGELMGHNNWFSKPPRREVLDPLFSPWYGRTLQGDLQLLSSTPDLPSSKSGTAAWQLEGLVMSATSIAPIWSIAELTEKEDDVEPIPFFDGESVGGSKPDSDDEREINLEDIEPAPPAAPTQIRNREWEARKFLAKERVRETRLKAQIAARMAEAEEARYYRHFGDLDDAESHFSEYDLTDESESEKEEKPGFRSLD